MKPISPEFLSGFTESDGSFYVSVEEKRLGRIMPKFHITQQSPPGRGPTPVLEGCRDFFGVGHYQRDKRWNCYTLTINSQWALRERVIPHFYSYPLLGEKKRDFLLFAEICHRLENKRRGDEKAWREIADLAVTMNRTSRRYRNHSGDGGESLRKLCDFRPSPAVLPPIHPLYVSGLTQGDGGSTMCFLQRGARPQFSVTSHNLSLDTLWGLKAFFGCGNVYSASETSSRYMVWGLRDLNEIIIPHFSRYPLWDEKARQLDLFSKGCRLLQVGGQDKMEELVDLLYVSNASGKRRRVDKQDYLEKWLS